MNKFCLGLVLLALGCAARGFADDADTRTAKVTDRSDAESQVSALTVSNVDERFGFAWLDDRGRIVVNTANIAWAIPVRAINSIRQDGNAAWTVKYQTKDGEIPVQGAFTEASELLGNSDFGSFSLPLLRLKRLDFSGPGVEPKPAKRPNVYDRDGHLRAANFDAVLTLTDGTEVSASILRRNDVFAEETGDPLTVSTAPPTYAVVVTNYTDLRLIRGETLQTVPFENIKTAEFLPGDAVLVKTKGGAEAEMKLPRRDERSIEGFTGFSSKGDFYVPMRYVRSIKFAGADAKPDQGN